MDFDAQGNLFISVGDNSNPFQSERLLAPSTAGPGRKVFDAQRTSGNTNDLRGKILRIKPMPDGTLHHPAGQPVRAGRRPARDLRHGQPQPLPHQRRSRARLALLGRGGPRRLRRLRRPRHPRARAATTSSTRPRAPGNYGWPYCIADNKPYVAFDFASSQSGAAFDCQAPGQQLAQQHRRPDPAARPAPPGSPTATARRAGAAAAARPWPAPCTSGSRAARPRSCRGPTTARSS